MKNIDKLHFLTKIRHWPQIIFIFWKVNLFCTRLVKIVFKMQIYLVHQLLNCSCMYWKNRPILSSKIRPINHKILISYTFCLIIEVVATLGINIFNLKWQCCIQSYFEAGIPVWHTKLKGVKINSSKNRQVIVVEPRQRCFKLFRIQNSDNFLELRPWTPLGRAFSTTPCPCPRIPSCTTVFLLARLVEKLSPPKNYWIRH